MRTRLAPKNKAMGMISAYRPPRSMPSHGSGSLPRSPFSGQPREARLPSAKRRLLGQIRQGRRVHCRARKNGKEGGTIDASAPALPSDHLPRTPRRGRRAAHRCRRAGDRTLRAGISALERDDVEVHVATLRRLGPEALLEPLAHARGRRVHVLRAEKHGRGAERREGASRESPSEGARRT